MATIKCELCGENEFIKRDGMFICQGCGTKYSLDDAKKLIHNDHQKSENQVSVSLQNPVSFYYEDEIGIFMKDKLIISPEGITWKKKTYSLNSISRIRFGGTLHSIIFAFNIFDICTTYTVYFGTDNKLLKINPSKEKYVEIVDNLWKAVSSNIIKMTLAHLNVGKTFPLGDIGIFTLQDLGVEFLDDWNINYNYTLSLLKWEDLNVTWKFGTGSGFLLIYLYTGNKWQDVVCGEFLNDDNIPIYEYLFRLAEKYKPKRLSDLLKISGQL